MPLPRQGKGGIDLATYTANYGLHQWEATDDFLRTDFNTDHQLIDAALGELAEGKAEAVYGSYAGSGEAGTDAKNSLSFPFQPGMVILQGTEHQFVTLAVLPYWEGDAKGIYAVGGTTLSVDCEGNTVRWWANYSTEQFNDAGKTYYYMCIKG